MANEILIIDDEAGVRDVIASYLKSLGHAVAKAADGPAGIALCRELEPALVLCDLRMPGMDGLEVLAVIKREYPETPVIVVSGMGAFNDAIAALKLGAWDYITKPIEDFAVLDHAVDRALERARLRAENRAYREHLESVNAQLYESLRQLQEDEAAGRKIQFKLLPEERVEFAGFEFSRQLVTSAILSGDFIDYFAIDDRHAAFYMADVSGHGVPSAFVTVLLKSYLSRYLERHRHHGDRTIFDPAAVLAELNRDILSERHGKYLTMFYGVLNAAEGWLDFGNGGQFPFPFVFDGKTVEPIGGKSPPVGLFEQARYRTQRLRLPGRFALSLFSDGILETLQEPDLAAKLAFLQRFAGRDDLDALGLAAALSVDQSSAPPDDISVFTLRRLAPR